MNSLFSLIKKLNKSEKRRFKLNSLKQKGQNQYLILFEFMEAMSSDNEVYNEEKLIYLLEKEDFFKKNKNSTTNINYLKAMQFYLKYQILKTLRTLYEAEKEPSYLIKMNLINAELTGRKSLDKLTQKEIKKAIALAHQFELTDDLFQIKRLQIGMAHYSFDKNTAQKINKLHQEQFQLLKQMQLETEYSELYYKLYHAYLEGFRYSKNKNVLNFFEEKVNALDIKEAADNFHTHYIFYKIKAFFCLLTNQLDHAFAHLHEALKLWENREIFIKKYPMRYQALLANCLNICMTTNKYEQDYDILLEKMKQLKIDHQKDNIYNQTMIMQIEQLRILNTNSLDEAVSFVKKIDNFLIKNKKEVTDAKWFNFQYNIMVLYFMMEDYKNALIRSKKLLNFKNKGVRKDLKGKIIVFFLIFLYERNKEKELTSILLDKEDDEYWNAIASARGQLRRRKQHNDFHRLIQQCLLNMTFVNGSENLKFEFHKMKSKLFGLREKIGQTNIGGLGIQEAIYWVESKITGQSIRSIIDKSQSN